MIQPDPNYVASDRPVNRRTAGRQLQEPPPVNPLAQERLLAARARNQLGLSLAEQVRLESTVRAGPIGAGAIAGAVVAAVGGVALLLAWLQQSLLLIALGVVMLLAGAWLVLRSQRSASMASDVPPPVALFDAASLAALDRALEDVGPELPDAAMAELGGLKLLIVRIARQGNAAGVDENFTMEDRLYVKECVRRYLPDTLQSYIAVPRNQRAAAILEDSQSAGELLLVQLAMLRAELEKREARMARSAAEQLLRQQRFLKSKSSR